jgi:hypothetical protein
MFALLAGIFSIVVLARNIALEKELRDLGHGNQCGHDRSLRPGFIEFVFDFAPCFFWLYLVYLSGTAMHLPLRVSDIC